MLFQQIINGLITSSLYMLVALGLTIVLGLFDLANFAHGEIYMLGAYAIYFLFIGLNLPYILALAIGMIIIGIFGVVLEYLVFRPLRFSTGLYAMIASIGVSMVLQNSVMLLYTPNPRQMTTKLSEITITFLGAYVNMQRIAIFFASIIIVILLSFFIRRSKIGLAMRACAQDMEITQIFGVNINKVASITFLLGSGLAAIAGGLMGPLFMIYPTMGSSLVIKAFAIVILGGSGSIVGAVIGSFVLGISEALGAAYISAAYKDAIAFFILIIVMILKPDGIMGKFVKTIEKV